MYTASLDVQSFISPFITEVLGWRRTPEELRTQIIGMRLKDKHRDEDHCHLCCVFFRVGF
jgi:hypothetical protein